MVDPIGQKPTIAVDRPVAPVAPVTPPAAPQPVAPDTAVRADPSTVRTLAQPLAEAPPVDAERVARIKKAIQNGHFPLLPSTVADRLLALKLQWDPNGEQNDPA